jgi:hypothetical protein
MSHAFVHLTSLCLETHHKEATSVMDDPTGKAAGTVGDVAGSMVCLYRDPSVSEMVCVGAGGEFLLSN